MKNAPIVILDEATAFADPENEFLVQRAFEELAKDKTSNTVTGAEAAKMLLVALGFKSEIEGFTGANWAVNVNVRANQKVTSGRET